ncbi:lytic transglycosylase domain-containing protein [Acidithiobacillus sulfuriphilus]|uniref:lytic transglycosylase domain-containing protein n=1 Tax=Acidithiobacillus sulfuriphilus TaxID=1867749 RepID=UPI003F62907E
MIPLNHLVTECAPMVAPSTMAAIVRAESGGNPLAMWNNTTRQRIRPPNLSSAVAYLLAAMAAGQRVDVGIAQVDTQNFAAFGLTPKTAFNACANLRVGAEILRANWQQALHAGLRGQPALYHAFEAYNSGRLWGDAIYANRILGAAGAPVFVQDYAGSHGAVRHRLANSFPQLVWPRMKSVSWSISP